MWGGEDAPELFTQRVPAGVELLDPVGLEY
jgi:hypothetical protein